VPELLDVEIQARWHLSSLDGRPGWFGFPTSSFYKSVYPAPTSLQTQQCQGRAKIQHEKSRMLAAFNEELEQVLENLDRFVESYSNVDEFLQKLAACFDESEKPTQRSNRPLDTSDSRLSIYTPTRRYKIDAMAVPFFLAFFYYFYYFYLIFFKGKFFLGKR
jgi:hypothetical protein